MGQLSRNSSRPESVDEVAVEVKNEESGDDEPVEELKSGRVAEIKGEGSISPSASPSLNPVRRKTSRSSSSSTSSSNRPLAAERDRVTAKKEVHEANGHNSTSTSPVKLEPKEPSKPAKASRGAASKLPPRVAPLFDHLPDATKEATSSFTVIDFCTYQNKYLGFSEHALDCDCGEEWGESSFSMSRN